MQIKYFVTCQIMEWPYLMFSDVLCGLPDAAVLEEEAVRPMWVCRTPVIGGRSFNQRLFT